MGHCDLPTTSAPVQASPCGHAYSISINGSLALEPTDDRCKCCVYNMCSLKIGSRKKGSHAQPSGWTVTKYSPHSYSVKILPFKRSIICVHMTTVLSTLRNQLGSWINMVNWASLKEPESRDSQRKKVRGLSMSCRMRPGSWNFSGARFVHESLLSYQSCVSFDFFIICQTSAKRRNSRLSFWEFWWKKTLDPCLLHPIRMTKEKKRMLL